VILGLGVWFTQEKTPSKPLAFGKRQRRRERARLKRSGATTVPAPFPAKTLQNRHFLLTQHFTFVISRAMLSRLAGLFIMAMRRFSDTR